MYTYLMLNRAFCDAASSSAWAYFDDDITTKQWLEWDKTYCAGWEL